ncbi:hypothetical protein NTGM5_760021 [Candidatus Nitrotoga sp. M5]|nr:hypothetical protein NTGM5_760021 [Candidatus Nitrotoga sp. M5]
MCRIQLLISICRARWEKLINVLINNLFVCKAGGGVGHIAPTYVNVSGGLLPEER